MGLKIQELIRNRGTCLNIVSCPMTEKKKKSGDVIGKYGSDEGECARKNKPRRHSSVHEQVSLLIIKIVVMCRNTKAGIRSVWRVFSNIMVPYGTWRPPAMIGPRPGQKSKSPLRRIKKYYL